MRRIEVSRRNLLTTGACALVSTASLPGSVGASALEGQNLTNEEIAREFYTSWEQNNWAPFDKLLSDNFTFTSPNGDDHISKTAYKARCWESQVGFVERFDLERIATGADYAFVRYLCHTKNGKSFRNVEYLRMKNGKLESIECYFGQQAAFASAVGTTEK